MPLGALYCSDNKTNAHHFIENKYVLLYRVPIVLVVLRPYTMSTYFIRDGCRYHHNNKILCIQPSIDNVEEIKTIY